MVVSFDWIDLIDNNSNFIALPSEKKKVLTDGKQSDPIGVPFFSFEMRNPKIEKIL